MPIAINPTLDPVKVVQDFLAVLPTFSPQDLQAIQQILGGTFAKAQATTTEANKTFDKDFKINQLNIPAEYLVNYHLWFFQAFVEEIFRPYQEGFYNPSDSDALTNDASIKVSSSWDDTDIKTGQNTHIVVDSESMILSSMYIGETSELGGSVNGNTTTMNNACKMDVGMLFQVIAGRPQEATNLANTLAMSLAKTRRFVRELFGLHFVSYPAMIPAAPMEGAPVQKYLASVRFSTTKFVHWNESITEQAYKNIIYRLTAVVGDKDNNPLVQMILGSETLSLDPNLRDYLRVAIERVQNRK